MGASYGLPKPRSGYISLLGGLHCVVEVVDSGWEFSPERIDPVVSSLSDVMLGAGRQRRVSWLTGRSLRVDCSSCNSLLVLAEMSSLAFSGASSLIVEAGFRGRGRACYHRTLYAFLCLSHEFSLPGKRSF